LANMTYCGTIVTCEGSIMAASTMINARLRPRQRSRANA